MTESIMVKVYLTESDKLLKLVMNYLHNEAKVRGVTILRAISGFGESGAMHSVDLLTMSMNLPLIIEFFDERKKIDGIIDYLKTLLSEGHIVWWPINIV